MEEGSIPGVVVIPTYNERENIIPLITEILSLPANLNILIVDDNSPDGTGKVADDLSRKYDGRISVLHRAGKMGLGTAYQEGLRLALNSDLRYEYLVSMDADFSHNPQSIPPLVEKITNDECDVAFGSRYASEGGVEGCRIWRRFISRGANFFASLMLGLTSSDNTGAFRCFKREVVEKLLEAPIFSSGYSFLIEVAYRCHMKGSKIAEVPITYVNRQEGASKISRKEIIKAVYTVFRLRWQALP
ncbi:MAG: polyprenol monophosphomannose synthase [Actinomycetota bacterium]